MYGCIKSKGFSGDLSYAYGKCLGYVDDNEFDRIYELKNESTDKWLIEYYTNGIMEEPIVLREISTKTNNNILSSVQSFDYEYWK